MVAKNKWLVGIVISLIGIALGVVGIVKFSSIFFQRTTNGDSIVISTGDIIGNPIFNFSRPAGVADVSSRELGKLKEKIEELESYRGSFPNRPKLAIANPRVTMINYTADVVPAGLVKGGFEITFFNIGGVEAKDLVTKWTIVDNGRRITGLNEWLTEYLGQRPLVIKNIPSENARSLKYVPDMTTYGKGKIALTLDYSYINANTGETYSERYKGFVLYEIPKDNKPIDYNFSKLQ
ncbi:MAG: hypothetical protein NG740_00700 [Omnitrophica bacterium]|nr:hypothetical protein [Candidatus Omnitrophota bacterium]